MGVRQLDHRGGQAGLLRASPPGSQDSYLCPVGRDSGYTWEMGRWYPPYLQVPSWGPGVCQPTCGLVQPCMDPS